MSKMINLYINYVEPAPIDGSANYLTYLSKEISAEVIDKWEVREFFVRKNDFDQLKNDVLRNKISNCLTSLFYDIRQGVQISNIALFVPIYLQETDLFKDLTILCAQNYDINVIVVNTNKNEGRLCTVNYTRRSREIHFIVSETRMKLEELN